MMIVTAELPAWTETEENLHPDANRNAQDFSHIPILIPTLHREVLKCIHFPSKN